MPDIRLLPLDLIDPPLHPIRSSIDEVAMTKLCASIRNQGLIQPVAVRDTMDGRFRLIAGSRRTQAHALLGLENIECLVRHCTDQEEEEILLSENLHREDMAPLDEANWLKAHMERYTLSVEQLALRVDCSTSRIYGLLSLLSGDPRVAEALSNGQIKKAQALAINRIHDPAGRETGLHWAIHQGMSADVIRAWAEERERKGIDNTVSQETWDEAVNVAQETKNLAKCILHEDWVEYKQAMWITVCVTCWREVLAAVEWAQKYDAERRESDLAEQEHPGSGWDVHVDRPSPDGIKRRDSRIEHHGHGGRPFKNHLSDEAKGGVWDG